MFLQEKPFGDPICHESSYMSIDIMIKYIKKYILIDLDYINLKNFEFPNRFCIFLKTEEDHSKYN